MAATLSTQQTDWKDKYFKAVNEFDRNEQDWSAQSERSNRDLLRLLEHFRGHQSSFDQALDAVVKETERNQLYRNRITELVVQAAEIHAATSSQTEALRATKNAARLALTQLLDALVLPLSSAEDISSIRATLDPAGPQETVDLLANIGKIAGVLNQLLDTPNNGSRAAKDALQTLLDNLSLPSDVEPRIKALTGQLQAVADDDVAPLAKSMADFFHDYIGSLQSELSGLNSFLLTIKERLDGVSDHLSSDKLEQLRQRDAQAELNEDMRHGFENIRTEIDSSDSLPKLKAAIQAQINLLDGNLDHYLSQESAYLANRLQGHDELCEELDKLRLESEVLRKELSEAQVKAASDALTGLPNRAAYNERLRSEHALMLRHGTPLSLVILDLDKFKTINDTWGHQAGDRVLKHVSSELRRQIREHDFFARIGGEEFVLLLPQTDLAKAMALAENLRRHVDGCRFTYKQSPVTVTISCGVSEFGPDETPASAFERADRGLYAAKNNGRNCCQAAA